MINLEAEILIARRGVKAKSSCELAAPSVLATLGSVSVGGADCGSYVGVVVFPPDFRVGPNAGEDVWGGRVFIVGGFGDNVSLRGAWQIVCPHFSSGLLQAQTNACASNIPGYDFEILLAVHIRRFHGPFVSGNPKVGEDIPICEKLGCYCRAHIDGEPTSPNHAERLGEDNAKLAGRVLRHGAAEPGRVLRARTSLVARPFPCTGLGIVNRVYRKGVSRFVRKYGEVQGLPEEVQIQPRIA